MLQCAVLLKLMFQSPDTLLVQASIRFYCVLSQTRTSGERVEILRHDRMRRQTEACDRLGLAISDSTHATSRLRPLLESPKQYQQAVGEAIFDHELPASDTSLHPPTQREKGRPLEAPAQEFVEQLKKHHIESTSRRLVGSHYVNIVVDSVEADVCLLRPCAIGSFWGSALISRPPCSFSHVLNIRRRTTTRRWSRRTLATLRTTTQAGQRSMPTTLG